MTLLCSRGQTWVCTHVSPRQAASLGTAGFPRALTMGHHWSQGVIGHGMSLAMGYHRPCSATACQRPWGAVPRGRGSAGRDGRAAQCFATIARGCWIWRVVGSLRDGLGWGAFDTTLMTQPDHLRPSGSLQRPEHPSVPDTLLEQDPELLVSEVALGLLVACHALQSLSSSCTPQTPCTP